MDAGFDGSVYSSIESRGLSATKRHVGDRALEALAFAGLGSLDLFLMGGGGVLNTLDDIGHAAGAIGAQYLDGVNMGLLGNSVLLACNGTGAVSAVTVAILVGVTRWNGFSPLGATFKVDVVDVGARVNNICIDALTALGGE